MERPIERPIKTFDESQVLRDSEVFDYLIFRTIDRIGWTCSTIWDSERSAKNSLLNLTTQIYRVETLLYSKIKVKPEVHEKYLQEKPNIFKDLEVKNSKKIQQLVLGNPFDQLIYCIECEKWLRALDRFMTSMKRMKRVSLIAGEGLPEFNVSGSE